MTEYSTEHRQMSPALSKLKRQLRDHLPNSIYVRRQYRFRTGASLDLRNPKGLSEKICWLKLYGMTPLHRFCTDKITAPAYVAARLGPGHTVPRLFATYELQDISPERLEWRQVMIKTNHDQGGVFPVPDKAATDWEALRQELARRMSNPFYRNLRELQYRGIRPGIVVEELLLSPTDPFVTDLRVYCFNGIPRFVRTTQLDISFRPARKVMGCGFDFQGRPVPFFLPTDTEPGAPPEGLEEIFEMARRLAAPFALVRVDLMRIGGKTYVGELTMTPNGGLRRFEPVEHDRLLGAELDHRAPCTNWEQYLDDALQHLDVCRIHTATSGSGEMTPSLVKALSS